MIGQRFARILGISRRKAAVCPSQSQFFDEQLILVDEEDRIQGCLSKLKSHTIVDGKSPLHRAFSLFHFNSSKKLLVQKRSSVKVTFPNLWTNTCCSHPLYTLSEMDDKEGVKTAAKRRADFELGLKLESKKIHHLTRILYSSNCSDELAENELDHCVLSFGEFDFSRNSDEVSHTKWLSKEDLKPFVNSENVTPWFSKIVESGLLEDWWKKLPNDLPSDDLIHKL